MLTASNMTSYSFNSNYYSSSSTTSTAPCCSNTANKNKTWRSLDLTQHNPTSSSSSSVSPTPGLLTINCNLSATSPHSPSASHQMLTPNTISNLAQIGGGQSPSSAGYYYEQAHMVLPSSGSRLDFKNRRSSSEPVQDLLASHSGSCLVNALQQQHQHHQQQQAQQQQLQATTDRHPEVIQHHQIVIHSANPIECLDAALKVRAQVETEIGD